MKRIWLITLGIVILLAVAVVIIKVTGTGQKHHTPDNIPVAQTDSDYIEDGDDSEVIDDYVVELQENEVIDFR